MDLYLSEFEAFANDSVYSKSISHEGPYATLVGIDENKDGSYFLFTNLNSFVFNYRFFLQKRGCCVASYKDHLFVLHSSLLSNLIPTHTNVTISLKLRDIMIKTEYRPEHQFVEGIGVSARTVMPERPEEGEIIYRFTKFIPWRQVK